MSAGDTISALAGVDRDLLLAPAAAARVGTVDLGHGTVEIPSVSANGLNVESAGIGLTIDLPGASNAARGVSLDDGTVTYPSKDFSNSVIASEAGLQLLTTIAGPDAPARYEYPIDLPRLIGPGVLGGVEYKDKYCK
ncbi:MAG: hypothetical protein P0Y48_11615 [Candidatus Microbacterium phytovorans]|uniref:Uncharacterized protein n=1 Tax=Candidatus Microbacterium phytovorans TaxID=3121374 RepID=A0AAJ5VZ83_9MICO|nr:hypothetical protein [Microbacterium sp.]WEK13106.1 MAG: hypothetical protein P0Y48_11615 [Microbacterium sp.]